jgi:multicomponent Na+:H+ antiporter subunit B
VIETATIAALLAMMAAVAVAISRTRNLFGVVVLSGAYSFIMATVLAALDAADVAMTEAAVGAGISTVLLLGALHLSGSLEAKPARRPGVALAIVIFAGLLVVYGTYGLPAFNDPQAPIHRHVAPRYLEEGPKETGVPNVVTAVLASYRGYDTLGETTVVFTAGIAVIALLRRRRGKGAEERA